MSARPVDHVTTRVSRAVAGDNRFRGHSVDRELAGQLTLTAQVALAIRGRRFDDEECAALDVIASSCLAADPRLWPMKVGVLGAAYGRVVPGVALAHLVFDSDMLGPVSIGECAKMLSEIGRELGERVRDPSAAAAALQGRMARGERLRGFGTPFRSGDERLVTMRRLFRASGRAERAHWLLAEGLAQAMVAAKGVAPNVSLGVAAGLLDLGFDPPGCAAMSLALMAPTMFGPAIERACEPSAVLQELPIESVRYTGPPPRLSPRALAAQASERATKPSGDAGSGSAPE